MGNVHGQASIKLNTIPANTSLLGGHFVYYQGDQQGTVASANVVENVDSNPANWGYNTHIGANGLQLRDGINAKATLTTTGLVISQGGIEAGTRASTGQPSNDGYIYVSSVDGPRISINSFLPADTQGAPQWREIIGSKFGVLSDGTLFANNANVSGNITATSLIIQGDGGSTYDGTAAINISGYNIAIVNNSTGAAPSGTYLYPHMYHNGENIDNNKIESKDTTVNPNKEYFEKVGNDYIKIDSPTGNPSTQNYYEKEITPYYYIWYKDNQTVGANGNIIDGHYFAEYGHTYRVTYSFDDGAVEGGTSTQYVEVDPSKYITPISDTGINIHPEYQANTYLQLNNNGLNIIETESGKSVAKFIANGIQIGNDEGFNVKLDNDELGFYDTTNRVAYINQKTLYITQSVVVDEMRVGIKETNLEKREEWSWKYDKSDRSLYLKWIGV